MLKFISPSILVRAGQYAQSRNIGMIPDIGEGKDGVVWRTSRGTAVKFHNEPSSYHVERDAYKRLLELGIRSIAGFTIPKLEEFDDLFLAIEMEIVLPPFCVDFASALFDFPPEFNEDEGHTFEDFIRARFDDRAPLALEFYFELADRTGIYLSDLHPANLKFE